MAVNAYAQKNSPRFLKGNAGCFFVGWLSGVEPESEAPQTSVLTITP